MKKSLILGTRASRLALTQTGQMRDLLAKVFPDLDITIKKIKTEGDMDRTSPLTDFEGRGAFVRSIENALLNGDIDIAVHSLKDLPSSLPDGLALGSVPDRVDIRDALSSRDDLDFTSLPAGSRVGTGSERRSSQLADLRPDLEFAGIRGNVETRLSKVESGEYDAVVLASAGLTRLGLTDRVTQTFSIDECIPAPCQGAIGIECRDGDTETLELLEKIDNRDARDCVDVERTFIGTLGMGCHTPVGAYAAIDGDSIDFRAFMKSERDGALLRRRIQASREEINNAAHELALELRKMNE